MNCSQRGKPMQNFLVIFLSVLVTLIDAIPNVVYRSPPSKRAENSANRYVSKTGTTGTPLERWCMKSKSSQFNVPSRREIAPRIRTQKHLFPNQLGSWLFAFRKYDQFLL